MIVINLWGAPGSGKSTSAAYIFSHLKMLGCNVELVTEFAKDLTWESRDSDLLNQLYVSGGQAQRLSRLERKVDIAITDSPLPSGLIYAQQKESELLRPMLYHEFNKYQNMNFLVSRSKPYMQIGRKQTEEESDIIAEAIESEVRTYLPGTIYKVCGDLDGCETMIKIIKDYLLSEGILEVATGQA